MRIQNVIKDDLDLLNIPPALIEVLQIHSLNRDRLMTMTADDLSTYLNIDIEAAKLIINSVTNPRSMYHDMRELI